MLFSYSIRSLVNDLIAANSVKRLADISFMGAMDALVQDKSKKSGSRLDHSIGVASLTERIFLSWNADERSTKLAVSAAMLHDIGHTIFSHSAESYLRKRYLVDHADVGQVMLRNDITIRQILERHEIDVNDVIAVLEESPARPPNENLHYLFSQPINPDTIEGIYRAQRFFEPCRSYSFPNPTPYFCKVHGKSFLREADRFWMTKNHIYNTYITSGNFSKYDFYLTDYLTHNDIAMEDLFLVDSVFEMPFRDFVERLEAQQQFSFSECRSKKGREYCIDDVPIESMSDLNSRYTVHYEGGSRGKWRQSLSKEQREKRSKSWMRLEALVKEKFAPT